MKPNALFTNSLTYFTAVYRQRSFSKAAATIPISTQGLHKSINVLEQALGVPLFTLTGNGTVSPTPQAEELFSTVTQWMGDMKSLRDRFDNLQHINLETIHLVTARGVLGFLGFDFADRFHYEFPAHQLDIVEQFDFLVEEMVLDRVYDMAISVPPTNPDLDFVPLASDPSCIWLRRDHPLASRTTATISDLEGATVAITAMKNLASEFFLNAFEEKKVEPEHIICTTDMFYNYLYALSGDVIGIGLSHFCHQINKESNIVSIPLLDGYEWKIGFISRKGHKFDHSEKILMNFAANRIDSATAN